MQALPAQEAVGGDGQPGGGEDHRGIAQAEGREPVELIDQVRRDFGQGQFSGDFQRRDFGWDVLIVERLSQAAAKAVDLLLGQGHSGRARMPAELGEHVGQGGQRAANVVAGRGTG